MIGWKTLKPIKGAHSSQSVGSNQLYVEIMSDVVLDIDDSSFLLSALDLQIDHSILFLKVQTCKDLINDLSSPKCIKPMWL